MKTRSQDAKFTGLPNEMKAEIFSYLDKRSRLQVRFTCSSFKSIIDTYVGLIVTLSKKDWPRTRIVRNKNGTSLQMVKNKQFWKMEFLKRTCIRRAWVTNMTMTHLLRYPQYLTSILLGRGTSKVVAISLINQCLNLVDFQVQALVADRIQPEDFKNYDSAPHNILQKLRTLSLFMDPVSSVENWDTGAHNNLQILRRVRSPKLLRLYVDTWTSTNIGIFETVQVIIPFLFYHATLQTVIIGINHSTMEESQPTDIAIMEKLSKHYIEPIFNGLKLTQKFITLSNLKRIEFQAFYPYLKAQSRLEKLTVTNWLGHTQCWKLYNPIFQANAHSLQKVHLSIETDDPFDFQILANLQALKELALFANGVNLDHNVVNGVNVSALPQDVEMLILSNFLLRTSELMTIPVRLNKLRVMAIVQIRGTPSLRGGMNVDFTRRMLNMRNVEALLLCGIWLPTQVTKVAMQNLTELLTGRKEYFLITDQNPHTHNYWNLTRTGNAANANLSFHLLLSF